MMKKLLFALLLLSLSPLSFAPAAPGAYLTSWETYAVTAAFISVMVAVILLMLARLLDLRQLETVFKGELVFAGSTVFLVLMLIVLLNEAELVLIGDPASIDHPVGLMGVLLQATYNLPDPIQFPQGTTLTDVAILYLSPVAKCGHAFLRILYLGNLPTEGASTIYQEIFMSEQATGGGVKPITSIISQTVKLLDFYMLAYFLIVHLLNFIKHYALFFLSVGVVLRAFPPTRGAGAYLMALTLGLYFVLPFLFVFMSSLASTQLKGFVQDTGDPSLAKRFNCNLPEPPSPPDQCGAQNLYKQKEYETWIDSYADEQESMFNWIWPSFQRILVANFCLLPVVAMVGVLTFVLSTTSLFGGSIPEIGRGLIKLI